MRKPSIRARGRRDRAAAITMNEDTRPFRTGRTNRRRSGGRGSSEGGPDAGQSPDDHPAGEVRFDGGSRDEREDQDPVEEPVTGPTDDPISEQMGEGSVGGPGEDPGDREQDANVTRSQSFHEASGSFRDVGIAVLILLILAVLVWVLFVL